MKHLSRIIFLIIIVSTAVPFESNGQFQPAPVEKSKQKILFQGKVFYIHTVKPGQTLYSISRAYAVTVQDIAAANPNVTIEVISEGQSLKIPNISSVGELSESYFGLTENDFILHTVQTQQTVHFLSKKYNVSLEEIYYYNPGSEELIQANQVIKIPKEHILKHQTSAPDSNNSEKYYVKKGDTLYSLSKMFGIPIAEIIRVNPQLRWGLKEGMALNLVSDSSAFSYLQDSSLRVQIPQIELFKPIICDSIKENRTKESIKVVLLLPFHASDLLALDSITNDTVRRKHPSSKYRARGVSFAEFYEGFLISIDSLKKTGASITLFTYDTKSDTQQIDLILKEIEIIRPEIIYGPIIPENIKRVSIYSEKNKIPMILPLLTEKSQVTQGNPYAISLMPDLHTEFNQCADYLSQFHDKNILLVHNEDSVGLENIKEFRETLFAYFSSKATYEEALYKEIRVNDTTKQNLEHALRENMDNVVFIVSKEEAYVSNLIGMLRINQSLGYSINIFGLPEWQSFKNLRIELLHQMNTVLYTPFYIDYNNKSTLNFIRNCRDILGHEPYRTVNNGKGYNYTFLGYEAGLLFLNSFNNYGPEFINCFCNIEETLPQNHYKFEWNNDGGFSNTNINFINFTPEFELNKIDFESLEKLNTSSPELDLEINQFLNP